MMERKEKVRRITKFSSPLKYEGNLFLLILALILFLPVGILLLIKNASIAKENSRTYLVYHGKWGWLFFWGILFFPFSILLLFMNGVDRIDEETVIEEGSVIERQ